MYCKVSVGFKCVRTSRMDSFVNFSPLYSHVSRKAISVSQISADSYLIALYMNVVISYFVCVPKRKDIDITDVSFPSEKLEVAAVNNFCFYRGHENVGKRDCHFCTHCGIACLKIIFAFKMERVFF